MSIRLPAIATIGACEVLAKTLPTVILANNGVLRFDVSMVSSFDSAVISLLLQALRLSQAVGRSVEFVGVSPAMLNLARVYGVDGLLLSFSTITMRNEDEWTLACVDKL